MKARKKKKVSMRCRHNYGEMRYSSDLRDGNYQTCFKCGMVRFEGERYAYGSRLK